MNPILQFKTHHFFSSKECKITDISLSAVSHSDYHCQKYDLYFATANLKYFNKYSDKVEKEINNCRNIWTYNTISIGDIQDITQWYNNCDKNSESLSNITKKAEEQAKQDAEFQCNSDIDLNKMILLSGYTNCNQKEEFDYLIISQDTFENTEQIISKGSFSIDGGKFKQAINIGKEFTYINDYTVLTK